MDTKEYLERFLRKFRRLTPEEMRLLATKAGILQCSYVAYDEQEEIELL